MKNISQPRYFFTEMEMGNAFQEKLLSPAGLPGIGRFDGIFREITCGQGIPDFIALKTYGSLKQLGLSRNWGPLDSFIISLLSPFAPRTLSHIVKKSSFSVESTRRSLYHLEKSGCIEKTGKGSYLLRQELENKHIEIWAFELKLDNPKRAVFQAQQYRAFAQRAIIVAPPSQIKNYDRFEQALARWGIGLTSFDPMTGVFHLVRRSRKGKPLSKQQHIYAMSQMLVSKNVTWT